MDSQLQTIEKLRARVDTKPGFTTDSMYSAATAERIRNPVVVTRKVSGLKVDLTNNSGAEPCGTLPASRQNKQLLTSVSK